MGFGNQLERQLIGFGPHPGFRIAGVFFGHQSTVAFGVGTEIRINVMVTGAVVFVVRGRIEDRIQINGIDAKILQVIELVDDPLQIAAVAATLHVLPELRFAVGFFVILQLVPITAPGVHTPLLRRLHRVGTRDVGHGRVIRRIAVAEAPGGPMTAEHR